MRLLMLVSDAYGGFGGISQFNRDFCGAVSAAFSPERRGARLDMVVVPRSKSNHQASPQANHRGDPSDDVPRGVRQGAVPRGKLAYALTVSRMALAGWDVIVCGHINLMPVAALARRLSGAGTRLALVIHGDDAWTPVPLPGRRGLDLVIAVSAHTRDRFLSWAPVPPDRCLVLPNTTDTSRFTPGPVPEDLKADLGLSGHRVILGLARLEQRDREKGYDRVIRALPRIRARHPDVMLVVAGDGVERPNLEALAFELGVRQHVVFPGRIEESVKLDYYRLADCFILCGRLEGFGIVLLEAMACGVPAVASVRDASREVVAEGAFGELADPDDLDSIADALDRALNRPRGHVPEGIEEAFGPKVFRARVSALIDRLDRS